MGILVGGTSGGTGGGDGDVVVRIASGWVRMYQPVVSDFTDKAAYGQSLLSYFDTVGKLLGMAVAAGVDGPSGGVSSGASGGVQESDVGSGYDGRRPSGKPGAGPGERETRRAFRDGGVSFGAGVGADGGGKHGGVCGDVPLAGVCFDAGDDGGLRRGRTRSEEPAGGGGSGGSSDGKWRSATVAAKRVDARRSAGNVWSKIGVPFPTAAVAAGGSGAESDTVSCGVFGGERRGEQCGGTATSGVASDDGCDDGRGRSVGAWDRAGLTLGTCSMVEAFEGAAAMASGLPAEGKNWRKNRACAESRKRRLLQCAEYERKVKAGELVERTSQGVSFLASAPPFPGGMDRATMVRKYVYGIDA